MKEQRNPLIRLCEVANKRGVPTLSHYDYYFVSSNITLLFNSIKMQLQLLRQTFSYLFDGFLWRTYESLFTLNT